MDLQSSEAQILTHEGKYREAAALWENWINRFPKVAGRSLQGNSFRLAGLAQEAAQNYDLAIEYLEKSISQFENVRSSFEVKSRGQVLSGLVVTSYWGLTRSYAARYLKEHNEKDFQGAVKAERMLRARQFGDLTVLSACDTGSGKYYTGEGVMGLSRGFLVAGSRSVLASLWPIDSMSTVDFMTRFYQHLQSGKSKPEALRLVQLELMDVKASRMSIERGIRLSGKAQEQTNISHPYYWAAFVLTGE